MSEKRDYEKDYEEHWKEIVENSDGTINMDQLKRELSDALILCGSICKVYYHVTGGMVSKPFTDPDTVCNLADEHYESIYEDEKEEDNDN